MTPPRIAVVGAGLIGARHARIVQGSEVATLAAIADPSESAAALAAELDVPHRPGLSEVLAQDRPDGVILATPTPQHAAQALDCIAAGCPVLVEKPLTDTPADGAEVAAAAQTAGVPVLVGHHRRHNPKIAAAKAAIDGGRIGTPVVANALVWLMKPDAYFEPDWRRAPGAGPVLINLIHDIDLLRHLLGDVVAASATASHQRRGFAVEDTAAAVLRFAGGALGTVSVSDTAVAPWSWELTAAENPAYPATGQSCYWIAGTEGALEFPSLRLWRNPGARGWYEPIAATPIAVADADPLVRQIAHFADVICGKARPLVSAADGLAAVEVLAAIQASAVAGTEVPVGAATPPPPHQPH